MKAVLLRGYGGVDQLDFTDVPDPRPNRGEVLIRVISSSVNPIDYKLRSGAMRSAVHLNMPVILGRDVAGEVTALGGGVDRFAVGDLVMGLVNQSYAEYLTTGADILTRIPEGLGPRDAGVLPLVTITGAQLIENGVQPRTGEVVLVTGAAGSVGRTAVFVAKQHGAKVIAGVRAKQRADAEKSLGADLVIALDVVALDNVALDNVALDKDEGIAQLPELDAIADTIDGETLGRLLPKLKKSGRIASVLGNPEAAAKAGIDVREVWSRPDPERLRKLAEDYRDGKLKIPIAERVPLSDIRRAHELAEKGVEGKIAILP
ncbi:MAG TPA: NADP-dependent oxidoreductase [Bryobacteraceae bacterium]|nr:NADP-dependent oxidoreductase [Bryobacteraceae bacterium]